MNDKKEIIGAVRQVIVFCEEQKSKTVQFFKNGADINHNQVLHLINDIIIELYKICDEDRDI